MKLGTAPSSTSTTLPTTISVQSAWVLRMAAAEVLLRGDGGPARWSDYPDGAWFVLCGGEAQSLQGGPYASREFVHTSVPFVGEAYAALRSTGVPSERIITIAQVDDRSGLHVPPPRATVANPTPPPPPPSLLPHRLTAPLPTSFLTRSLTIIWGTYAMGVLRLSWAKRYLGTTTRSSSTAPRPRALGGSPRARAEGRTTTILTLTLPRL